MAFGKSNQPQRRHRPKKVVEIDEEEVREKREAKMNAPIISTVISVVGSFVMLGIVVMGAPYTYGSQVIHYSKKNIDKAHEFVKLSKNEREDEDIDAKLLVDFTTVITTPNDAKTEAMKKVAATCRQGRASTLNAITPDKVHAAVKKATKFLTCAMPTERTRFCAADERQLLVSQLMEYKERRMNAFAFEKYRAKRIEDHEAYRQTMRDQGGKVPAALDFPKAELDVEVDAGLLRQLRHLVANGYISAADFGYYGLLVPTEYHAALKNGADRFAPCATRT